MTKTKNLNRKFMIVTIIALIGALLGFLACVVPELSTTWYAYVDSNVEYEANASSITYYDIKKAQSTKAMPSVVGEGDSLNLLCVPVEFDGYEFSDSVIEDLNTLFNGSAEETGYWESVSSFYQKSSFGNFQFNVTITDIYKVKKTPEAYATTSDQTTITNSLVRSVVNSFKSAYDNYSSFDYDNNNYIDGIYLIYSCPDYSEAQKDENSYYYKSSETVDGENTKFNNLYWAYTGWYTSTAGFSSTDKKPNAYVWASYDFMYKAVSSPKVDAHTYIHETGHLLGLSDYYNYVPAADEAKYGSFAHHLPCGGLQMMDHNIGDFDAWTKYSLGWSKAYVVYKDKGFPQTIEIRDSSSTGDLLLIPASSGKYSGNAFGEYIALELYTPNGLNELDSKKTTLSGRGYLGSYPTMYDISGIRMSHIDSRLIRNRSYVEPTIEEVNGATSTSHYEVAAHNLLTEVSNPNPDRIFFMNQLIESSGEVTLVTETSFASNDSLFKGNNKKGNFDMNKSSDYFVIKDDSGSALLNSGEEFGYTIRVNGARTKNGVLTCSITISQEL